MINRDDIKKVSIYPPIGIARVGNAKDKWFFASEVRGLNLNIPSSSTGLGRDENGHILRQAVRFRIYAHLKDGSIQEITQTDDIQINWSVTIANLKSGWYDFNQAMDLPGQFVKTSFRRNKEILENREQLDITPKTKSISGPDIKGEAYHFSDGKFFGKNVYLGELQTDTEGRLIFLGGFGHSAPRVPGTKPTTFANNSEWHDDVSDGPVRATVIINGKELTAEPGYVVTAPPNYAPGLFGIVTMEDTVFEAWANAGWVDRPATSSFTHDVWPIFDRSSQMSWINHGIFVALGKGSPLDARHPKIIEQLRTKDANQAHWRSDVLKLFLPPNQTEFAPASLPQVFGDGYFETGDTSAIERLSITQTMYEHLQRWSEGDFTDDWSGSLPELPTFEDLQPEQQVYHLNRVALHECLGGPFHPGIEISWPLRDVRQWKEPYRLAIPSHDYPARQDYGSELTREVCLADGGPLSGVAAGSMTRWLGVPWQTDEASCNSDADYAPSLYLSMPSFWGARVPEQILSSEAWSRTSDSASTVSQRLKHFNYREDWLRDIRGRGYLDRISNMVTRWWELGVVSPIEVNDPKVEELSGGTAWIETGRSGDVAGTNNKLELVKQIEQLNAQTKTESGFAPEQAGQPYKGPRNRFKRGEV